ncbi:MAG: hypothetical protein ACXVBU_19465 [Ktedonobacteraceae bacterium]
MYRREELIQKDPMLAVTIVINVLVGVLDNRLIVTTGVQEELALFPEVLRRELWQTFWRFLSIQEKR